MGEEVYSNDKGETEDTRERVRPGVAIVDVRPSGQNFSGRRSDMGASRTEIVVAPFTELDLLWEQLYRPRAESP